MNYKELAEISQEQIRVLMATIASLSGNIQSLTEEVTQLRKLLLEKDKNAETLVNKLNGLAEISMPKKTERRKVSTSDNIEVAPTPKERGNNGAKHIVYDAEEVIEEIVELLIKTA